YADTLIGLVKFGTRLYDPGAGRWTQVDPSRGDIRDPLSLDLYLYVESDPINSVDPAGLSVWSWIYDNVIASFVAYQAGLGVWTLSCSAGFFVGGAIANAPGAVGGLIVGCGLGLPAAKISSEWVYHEIT